MLRRLAIATCLAIAGVASAQPAHLDPADVAGGPVEAQAPTIELLSFGVGARIFEKYGHSAICLRYHDPHIPAVCFNYGVTDFAAGWSLLWNFLRGEQKFWVEPTTYGAMINFYKWEDRDIYSQILPISDAAARKIEATLWASLEGEHRFYNYDHFFDNCATKLRNMIDDATGGGLRDDAPYPLTFREIGVRGLADLPPLIALSDFVLGRQLDDTPTVWEAMFQPEVLRDQVEGKLHAPARLVYQRRGPPFPTESTSWRFQMLGIAMIFALPLFVATWLRRFQRVALVWSTLYLALWGIVIWGLAIISSIQGFRWNEAVLVMVPFDIALPLLPIGLRRRYARVRVAILLGVSLLAGVGLFHQPLWIPILAAIVPLSIVAFDLPHNVLAKKAVPQPIDIPPTRKLTAASGGS
jgi:hypothetical protein